MSPEILAVPVTLALAAAFAILLWHCHRNPDARIVGTMERLCDALGNGVEWIEGKLPQMFAGALLLAALTVLYLVVTDVLRGLGVGS